MFRFRLHTKFLVLVLGSLVLFLGVLSFVLIRRETRLLEQKAEEKQHVLASAIHFDVKDSMMEGTSCRTLKLMEDLRGLYGLVRFEVLQKDGTPAFDSKRTRFSIPQVATVFETGRKASFRESGEPELHTILYPLKNEHGCTACHKKKQPMLGVLLISLSLDNSLREIAVGTRRLALFLSGMILIIGGLLYLLVRKVVLQPLDILHAGAERIGKGELTHRIELPTNDEMQDLAESLNGMAANLKLSYDGLEDGIRKRTAEIEDKAAQLYSYSRDMATISRVSRKLFNAEQSLDDMLDRFMRAVSRGLGYEKAVICLVDRKRAWLEVKRDHGLRSLLRISDQPLSGSEPFAEQVRAGRQFFVPDIARDPVFNRYRQTGSTAAIGINFLPILSGMHEKKCWQVKNCDRSDCPAFNGKDERCWLVPGTRCGNSLIESYGDKLAYCMSCDVFPVLGVMIVAVPSGRSFRRRDASVLRVLAAEMGAAIENHYLHNRNRELVKELIELHRVTAGALTDLSLDRALSAFADSALKFPGLDACNFWLLSDDCRELLRKTGSCSGEGREEEWPARVPANQGILCRALNENQVVAEYNIADNETTEPGRTAFLHGHQATLALPLKTQHRPLGVFSVHKKSRTPFLETEIAAFMLLANHATMAVNVCLLNEELKTQNRELAANSSLMSGILGSISSGVMLLDANGTVRLVNNAGAEILNSRPEEMLDRPLTDIYPETDVFLSSPVGPYQETAITRPDGKNLPVGFSISSYQGAAGAREGTIVTYRDLTEIKALESAVLSKERFAAVGKVVAGVAHEIRNPLFGISSIGQIFEKELKRPEHLELVKALLAETKRLNHLVEDLLIYARPVKLLLAWCDLAQLWRDVTGMHREELRQKGISIEFDFGMDSAPAFLDENQIRQVFLNLIRNAVDATASGGKITIRLMLDDEHIVFAVADSGVGIPVENIDKVFDIFFTTKPKGSGLGLAICRKIVEDHDGMICVESRVRQEGRGTTVIVRLPYRGASSGTRELASNCKQTPSIRSRAGTGKRFKK